MKPYHSHKFDFKTESYVFLGYSHVHKGYKCLTSYGKLILSRNAVFDENSFPFVETKQQNETYMPCQTITILPILCKPTSNPIPTSNLFELFLLSLHLVHHPLIVLVYLIILLSRTLNLSISLVQ